MATKINIIKNMVCFTAIALCVLAFASCKDKNPPNISMTVKLSKFQTNKDVIFYMAGSGTITIDWGDGTVESKMLRVYIDSLDNDTTYMFTHSYSRSYFHSYFRSSVHTIKIRGNNITHLTTVKYLPEFYFFISNNLTRLNVSRATSLIWLDCSHNELTELDLSQNTALLRLSCFRNQLTELDLSSNTALTSLNCIANQLTNLNLSANIALTRLECQNNKLTELDLSNNKMLANLDCSYNQLTSLNLNNNNTELYELRCNNNQLSSNTLNTLFRMLLHDEHEKKFIHISGNPGTKDCDKSIIEEKGWRVY